MKKVAKNYAVNCQGCGKEAINYQLRPVKMGTLVIDLCSFCHSFTEAYRNLKQAIYLLKDMEKFAEDDVQITSPNVVIEPVEPLVQKAVQLLKRIDSNYFVGVRKIVVGSSSQYGHVESGPGKDPTIININLKKITNGEIADSDAIIAIASVIAHEKGHLDGYDPEHGFANEGAADAEEHRILQWINNNNNLLSDILK